MDEMPGMWMEMDETPPEINLIEGAEVRAATSVADLAKVTDILTEGYPLVPDASDLFMRGIHLAGEENGGNLANFIAEVDGQPAACSSVCIKDGVAGVYCVATIERFRGKGLGGAVTRAAMRYAHERGIRHALLHASEMGVSVYKRIGFEEICRVPALVYGMGGEQENS
jgi:GNAT superfamily N-acetyltransferase